MKSLLAFLIFSMAVCQVFGINFSPKRYISRLFGRSESNEEKLHVTIFYSTLSPASKKFFKRQVASTFSDDAIRRITNVELVPFGKAIYTENPWTIICENGPDECYGNVMNACFMDKLPHKHRQIKFVSCCMSDFFPPHAGERCAQKLGYSFKGVHECIGNQEGINLQIRNGRRTLDFKPDITSLPTIVYDNVYNEKDNKESIDHLARVIKRKLQAKGVKI